MDVFSNNISTPTKNRYFLQISKYLKNGRRKVEKTGDFISHNCESHEKEEIPAKYGFSEFCDRVYVIYIIFAITTKNAIMKGNKKYSIEIDKKVTVEEPVSLSVYVGRIIKSKREAVGFTQIKLSKICGLYQTAIARIESGENSIRIDTLESLCNALDCKSSDLLPF